jgi:transcriptional regulator with PAS, ATPase and Fis domain
VGGDSPIEVEIRVLAATNRDLLQAVLEPNTLRNRMKKLGITHASHQIR